MSDTTQEIAPQLERKQPTRPIYLDHNATTPLDPEVLHAMKPYLEDEYGNASSATHSYGWSASTAVQRARKQVASLLQCSPTEIIWTSGATESNNMAILGIVRALRHERPHIITSPVEHKAVLDVCEYAQKEEGAELTLVDVNAYGQVEPSELKKAITKKTRLVSLMAANNEIGSINPIKELAAITKEAGALFHCDAAQAAGKIPLHLGELAVDMLSISGHKLYGPKGVGALFIRKKSPAIQLAPLMLGGAQEEGIRPGTLNVPGIVGLGKACELAAKIQQSEEERLLMLRQQLLAGLQDFSQHFQINGHPSERLANNLSLSFKDLPADLFTFGLSKLALSSGSACTSSDGQISHVLKAIGVPPELARATLRIGMGRFTSPEDIEVVVSVLRKLIKDKEMRAAPNKENT